MDNAIFHMLKYLRQIIQHDQSFVNHNMSFMNLFFSKLIRYKPHKFMAEHTSERLNQNYCAGP